MKMPFPCGHGLFRLTVHRVDWEAAEHCRLEQTVDYVGGSGGRGREFPLRAGVIGPCAKNGKLMIAHRQLNGDDGFLREMTDKWGFTNEEALKLSKDRWSYLAHPILTEQGDKAGAVLYIDSSEKGVFQKKHPKQLAEHWCRGLAAYLREVGDEASHV
ncbi:MAG: hypothetical protein KF869_00700 [Phycisphaeraceae bacterium]|nr:hypothetical protein [Phycisphaeraceae bacterium]